jgi:hypothetical protein
MAAPSGSGITTAQKVGRMAKWWFRVRDMPEVRGCGAGRPCRAVHGMQEQTSCWANIVCVAGTLASLQCSFSSRNIGPCSALSPKLCGLSSCARVQPASQAQQSRSFELLWNCCGAAAVLCSNLLLFSAAHLPCMFNTLECVHSDVLSSCCCCCCCCICLNSAACLPTIRHW